MTKANLTKGLNAYHAYLNSTARTLDEFYKNYSSDKYIAFSRIFNEAAAVQAASNVRILGGTALLFLARMNKGG